MTLTSGSFIGWARGDSQTVNSGWLPVEERIDPLKPGGPQPEPVGKSRTELPPIMLLESSSGCRFEHEAA